MTGVLTSAQMRALEHDAITSGTVTGLTLMERAGQGVLTAILNEWPDLAKTSHKALVLCGPGNNGGDGFVIARLLKQRGWDIELYLYGDPENLPPDARTNHDRWADMGTVSPLTAQSLTQDSFHTRKDLLIDALFGTGLTRPVDLPLFALDPHPEVGADHRIVAVDMPTGLCADSGRAIGREYVTADLTVTFHSLKLGHTLAEGPRTCGKTVIADIGLTTPPSTDTATLSTATLCTAPSQPSNLRKSRGAQKYTHGHALILSGPAGKTGAARLAARGALRIGAGLVTLATPHAALAENAAHLTAVMLTEIDTPEALAETLKDARINALCIGPGFGVDRADDMLPTVLAAKRPTVLDADALTALARDTSTFSKLHETCVLTPHEGEFKRLFPDIADRLAEPPTIGPAYSKLDATRAAAKRAGCTVLFKGPDTVIAAPDGRAAINAATYDRAAPWLATAGSGDVLAGFITGLLARGFAPMQAAKTAAWLHTEAALSFGPGLIAEDLPEELPKVLRALDP
ncbi:NAD(P)H-hydrate dehydratase [Celeribacter arenosi]|uniref:Bifunctional NAD(P)H-hydrate repair enzyme n=1 Tax=Celeribacter arenosi TaxID=792649 RepID=A0ABP7KD30_9RHOB